MRKKPGNEVKFGPKGKSSDSLVLSSVASTQPEQEPSIQAEIDDIAKQLMQAFKSSRQAQMFAADKKERFSDDRIDMSELFIPPLASLDEKNVIDCHDALSQFLASEKISLLILGDAGQGKTSLLKNTADQLWKDYIVARQAKKQALIPLYIHLSRLKQDSRQTQLLEDFLAKQGIGSKEILRLKFSQPLVLLLDGYDEIVERINFYDANHWSEWKLKVITASRPEAFRKYDRYPDYFAPKLNMNFFQELTLALFNKVKITEYIQLYLSKKIPEDKATDKDEDWCQSSTYLRHLEAIPSLWELAKTPVVLSMIVPNLPIIVSAVEAQVKDKAAKERDDFAPLAPGTGESVTEVKRSTEIKEPLKAASVDDDAKLVSSFVSAETLNISRAKLYDIITEEWFKREVFRSLNKVALRDKSYGVTYLKIYAENLAYHALRKGRGKLEVSFSSEETLDPELLRPTDLKLCLRYQEDKEEFKKLEVMQAFRSSCLLKASEGELFLFMIID